jgi:hypothetical protein
MYYTNPLITLFISRKSALRKILILWGSLLLVSCASPERPGDSELVKKTSQVDEVQINVDNAQASRETASTPIYQDSPMYLKDRQIVEMMPTTKNLAQLPNQEYYDSLDTQTLLQQAEAHYENEDYETASLLFNEAANRSDGRLMKTYAGLYQSHIKLDNQSAAEKAFAQLLTLSVKNNNRLNVKFLFSVNSTEFIENEELRREYSFWLKQISGYFQKNTLCFEMSGHSTLTEEQKDSSLSFLRAEKIQALMENSFAAVRQRSKAVGKGYQENIVGINTNDVRDTIDRRVEILVVNCSEI